MTKISELTLGSTPTGAELIPLVQSGATVRTRLDASLVSKRFTTLATATAATIPSHIDVVETLGRVAAGDNGGASYIRIAASTAAAWRFQSADGQWWALNNRAVTPEMFGCFSGADCTSAFQSMATWLNTAATGTSSTINFAPGADYQIWPAGTTPSIIFNLISTHGVVFNFNGARISTNNLFSPQGVPIVFQFQNTLGPIFNSPKYVQTAYTTPVVNTKGGFLIALSDQSAPYTSGVVINNLSQTGGLYGLVVAPGFITADTTHNITINNADFDSVYYPLSFQNGGDGFRGNNIKITATGRAYFPYGVSDHKVYIEGSTGTPDQLLLKVYAYPATALVGAKRNTLSDIEVTYRSAGLPAASGLGSIASLAFQQAYPEVTVSAAASNGGLVRLTVNSTANMATGQSWFVNSVGGNPGTINSLTWVITVINATTVDLQASTFSGAYTAGGYLRVPASMKNITINYDVSDKTGNQQPQAFRTEKYNSDGSTDTTTDGYSIENYTLTGTLKDYNYGVVAIDAFNNNGVSSVGTWVGETIRNFNLSKLTINGTNSTVLLNATNASSNFELDQLFCSAGITATLTGAGTNTRIKDVSCSGITDRITVVPSAAVASQYMTGIAAADGSITRAQPVKADVGLGNVDNTSDATKNAAVATLTNKTLTSSVGAGVWTVSGTWTLPAVTLGGAVTLANNTVFKINDSGAVARDAILIDASNNMTVANNAGGVINFKTSATPGSAFTALNIATNGNLTAAFGFFSTSPTAGIGYSTGAGGTVTQATSKATGVTLNTVTGLITMNAAALAAATIVSFALTDSAIVATDQIMVSHESGGTLGAYTVNGRATGAGTGAIDVRNNTAGSLSEAIVLRVSIFKSVNA